MLAKRCALDAHMPDLAPARDGERDLAAHLSAEEFDDGLLIEVTGVLAAYHEDFVAGDEPRERCAEALGNVSDVKGAGVVVAPEDRADRASLSGRRARCEDDGEKDEGAGDHSPDNSAELGGLPRPSTWATVRGWRERAWAALRERHFWAFFRLYSACLPPRRAPSGMTKSRAASPTRRAVMAICAAEEPASACRRGSRRRAIRPTRAVEAMRAGSAVQVGVLNS